MGRGIPFVCVFFFVGVPFSYFLGGRYPFLVAFCLGGYPSSRVVFFRWGGTPFVVVIFAGYLFFGVLTESQPNIACSRMAPQKQTHPHESLADKKTDHFCGAWNTLWVAIAKKP